MNGIDRKAYARHFDLVQQFNKRRALRRWNSPSAAVYEQSICVYGAEVASGGDIVLGHLDANAQSFENAAAHEILHRVVAEQGHVTGAAAGSDAVHDRRSQATGALFG